MHIALVAYGCEPNRGSEFGVGWSWLEELTRRGHTISAYVHGSQQDAIERWPGKLENVSFRYHWPAKWPLEHSNRAVHQLQYTLWQWSVIDQIRKDAKETGFDLVHFLTWGGIRMPVFGWRLSIPYVIGPVGGGEEPPLSYCRTVDRSLLIKELGRKLINRLCLVDPLLIAGYGLAWRTYAKTEESRQLIPKIGRAKSEVALEIGSRDDLLQKEPSRAREPGGSIRLISVGRLLSWKSPLTIIAVYKELLRRGIGAELILVGNGPERSKVEAALARLPPNASVRYESELAQPDLFALMHEQDVALFASLHDSSGNFVLESLALGLPVVALSLGGPKEILRNGGGVLIPVDGRTHEETVNIIADTVEGLHLNRDRLIDLRVSAKRNAQLTTFPRVVANVYEPIEDAISH